VSNIRNRNSLFLVAGINSYMAINKHKFRMVGTILYMSNICLFTSALIFAQNLVSADFKFCFSFNIFAMA